MIWLPIYCLDGIRRRQKLGILLLARLLSSFATGLFDIALLWLAIDATHRVEELATVLILRLLPFVLFGLAGGWLGDNLDRRRVIIAGDFGRAVTIVMSLLALAAGIDIIPVLAVSGFALTALHSISNPAVRAIVPELCGSDALHRANAILEMIGYAVVVITPALGGMALDRLSYGTVLACIGFLFLAASAISLELPRLRPRQSHSRLPARDYRLLLAFLLKRRRRFILFMGLNIGAVIAVSGAEALMIPARTYALFAQSPSFLGTVISVMAISAICGAMTAGLIGTWPQKVTIYCAWIVYALSLASVSLISDKPYLLVTVAVLGYSGAIIDTLITVMVQLTITSRHRSKLLGVMSIVLHTGDVTSMWLTAVLASALGFAVVFQLAAFATLAIAAAGLMLMKSEYRKESRP